ncbi:MAG: hypothetical protein LBI56_03585 [Puniceicoccales bacterium]|jgi:hypothetical protein|nr:hypothetical protein [Puniceicoccales bacterium]
MASPKSKNCAIRLFCLIIFFAVNLELQASDLHRLHRLSEKKANEFLGRARQASLHFSARGDIAFELHSSGSARDKKFGKISYFSGGDEKFFTVDFGAGECVFSDENFASNGQSDAAMDRPFFEHLIFAPRDLAFIFLGNGSHRYAGPAQISGRPAQQFICSANISLDGSAVAMVKTSIDEKFLMVLRVDFFNCAGKLVRRISVGSLKRFGELWMPGVIEFSDFANHRRVKLEITAAEFPIQQ